MGTHIKLLAPAIHPTEIRRTAILDSRVINQWDCAWMKIIKELIVDPFLRYVDDCRVVMPGLNEG